MGSELPPTGGVCKLGLEPAEKANRPNFVVILIIFVILPSLPLCHARAFPHCLPNACKCVLAEGGLSEPLTFWVLFSPESLLLQKTEGTFVDLGGFIALEVLFGFVGRVAFTRG